jgi:hypothetical protein
MALITCMNRFPMRGDGNVLLPPDRDALRKAAAAYQERGLSQKDAEIKAVQDMLDQLNGELESVYETVAKAFNKAPKPKKKAEPKAVEKKAEPKAVEKPVEKPAPTPQQEANRSEGAGAWNKIFKGLPSIPLFMDLPAQLQQQWLELGPKEWNRTNAVDIVQSLEAGDIVKRSEREQRRPRGELMADEVLDEIKEFIGAENLNKVKVFESTEDIYEWVREEVERQTGEITQTTQAFVYDGVAYFIAENIPAGKVRAVFMHEVGAHLGLENLLSSQQYEIVVDQIKEWASREDGSIESRVAQAAFKRVYNANQTSKGGFNNNELVAYFLEEAIEQGLNPTAVNKHSDVGRWFRKLWAAYKAALRKLGLTDVKLQAQDILDLAYGAARAEMSGAWHGTHAKFHRFNNRHRGTGEGRLAAGDDNYTDMVAYGVYLADVRGVSEAYRETLSHTRGLRPVAMVDDKPMFEVMKDHPAWRAAAKWGKEVHGDEDLVVDNVVKELLSGYSVDELFKQYQEMKTNATAKGWTGEYVANVTHKVNLLASLKDKDVQIEHGSLYRVDTGIADDEWLDWEKPFNQQSEKVQEALQKMPPIAEDGVHRADLMLELWDAATTFVMAAGNSRDGKKAREVWEKALDTYEFDMHGATFEEHLKRAGATPAMMDAYKKEIRPDINKWISENKTVGVSGQAMYDAITDYYGNQRKASAALDAAGVKGVRYLDGASRDMGEGTHNYVVFNPKNTVIAKRNPRKAPVYKVQRSERAEAALSTLPKPAQSVFRGVWTTIKDLGKKGVYFSALTDDLADIARKTLPSVDKYLDAQHARQATRLKHEVEIDRVLQMYDHLPHEERGVHAGSVNAFIHDSTLSGKWGYKLTEQSDFQPDPEMKRRFDKLSPEGQQLVRAVFKHGHEMLKEKKAAVRAAMEAEGAGPEDLARFESLLDIGGKKPYAPLKRHGEYVVLGHSKRFADAKAAGDKTTIAFLETNPEHNFVAFAETLAEAEAIRDKIKGRFEASGGGAVASQREFEGQFLGKSTDFFVSFSRLRKAINEEGGDPKTVKAMDAMARDLYLMALSEASARKSELHRRGIPGSSKDMMRALATQGRSDAHFLSTVKHNEAVMDAIDAMRKEAKKGDRQEGMRLLNEFLKRHAQSMEKGPGRIENAIKRATSFWMLSTSPAFYAQQASQTYVMSLPILAGKHGWWKSEKSIRKAYMELGPMLKGLGINDSMDFSKAPADVREMLVTLVNNGKIDVGIDVEMGSWAKEGSGSAAWSRADRTLRGLMVRMESINRTSAAIAAFRMEKMKQLADGKLESEAAAAATKYAEKIVHMTHGSYDGFNTPRVLNSFPAARVITQFRRFQIIQLSLLVRLFQNSLKGADATERAVARKALMFTLGHSFLLTGAIGTPGVAAIAWLAGKLLLDDDEPDTEQTRELALRKAIGDDDIADLLIRGTPAAFGWDMSTRLGFTNTFSLLPFYQGDPATRKGYNELVVATLGPAFSLGGKFADGVGTIRNGEYYKGLEMLLPNGVANAMKGMRIAEDGITLRNGDVVLTPDEVSLLAALGQGIGLPTATVTERQFRQGVKTTYDTYYQQKTTEIKGNYLRAYRAGDAEAMSEARAEWTQLQESRQRNGYKREPLSTLLKAPQQAMKRERNTAGGVQFNSRNRGFVEGLQ